ncbi:MAG TPA: zinc ribbon domain-containing protein, partial [Candidatus Dormibacteraeota bacterium]|nr:zinc ribbon domain-containing protein [Candidatus Dormibacteraeota bacterium]
HRCGSIQDLGWAEHWTCDGCGARHQRDENAAINLARYSPVGSVGAFVKRRAAVRPGLLGHAAGKREAREGNPVRGAV